MLKELGALVSLQDFIAEFDAEDAKFYHLAVLGNKNGLLGELVIFPVQLVIVVEELEHLLVDRTSAPSVRFRALCNCCD